MNNLPSSDALRQHLQKTYECVFTPEAIEAHITNYIGYPYSDFLIGRMSSYLQPHHKILDVGCGYGSFVTRLREKKYQAFGIDTGETEINYAQARVNDTAIFQNASALDLPFSDQSFDIVTLWNILEHVPDYKKVISEAKRVLKVGGRLFIECPNYAAFRQEAHYHVPWYPLLPRQIAKKYLIKKGKNPSFFENHIYYCTHWGVLTALKKYGFKIEFYPVERFKTRKIAKLIPFLASLYSLKYWMNPLIHSTEVMAVKNG